MKKQNTTKKALLMSVLSTVLCLTMLVGSTFAWFTDSATTGVNTIQAGNLDVMLMMKDGENWVDAEGKVLNFKKAGAASAEPVLFEPGATYELPALRIDNNGNLALKFKLLVNGVSGDMALAELLRVKISVDGAEAYDAGTLYSLMTDEDGAAYGVLKAKEKTAEYTIALHMPTSAGNEYMNMKLENMAFTVIAAQLADENDSYGNQYDKDALYPDVISTVYTKSEQTTLGEATDTINAVIPANTELIYVDDGTQVADNTTLILSIEESATPGNFDVSVASDTDTFEICLKASDGRKVRATSPIEVNLFIGKDRDGQILVYHNTDLVHGTVYDPSTGYVTFETMSFSPYSVVEIDIDDSWYNAEADEFIINNYSELLGFAQLVDNGTTFADKTVKLGADIDLLGADWEPIGALGKPFSGSFDGQGHTISNLYIKKEVGNIAASNRQGFFSSVKPSGAIFMGNVTIKNVNITAGYHVGAFVATSDESSQNATGNYLVMKNVNLIGDVTIYGFEGVGGVMGSGNMAEISDITVDVNEGSYVTTMPNGRTNSFACVGSVKGGGYFEKADNITSNMDVTAKTAGTGGLFGVIGGQTVTCYLSNLSYSGKVTLTESSVDKYGNYSNYQHNGLLVGAGRFNIVADKDTCTSTGTLELHTENDVVYTSNNMADSYTWGGDLFGASRDKDFTNKSYSKTYTAS